MTARRKRTPQINSADADKPVATVAQPAARKSKPGTPRQIIVHCEGYGAGPGLGWWYYAYFVEMKPDTFSIFLEADLDCSVYELFDLPEPEEPEEPDWDNWEEPERVAVRVKTVNEPLTWRQVLRFLLRTDYLHGFEADATVEVDGAEPWEADLIRHLLVRPRLARFIRTLPDEELIELHARTGGLKNELNRKRLRRLAEALSKAGLEKQPLRQLAELAGAPDPFDIPALTRALQLYAQERDPSSPA